MAWDKGYSERQQSVGEFGTCLVQIVACQIEYYMLIHPICMFIFQQYTRGLGYMSMIMLAGMQLAI